MGSTIAPVTCSTAFAVVVGLGVLNAQAPASKPGDSSVTVKLDQWAAKTLPGVRTHLKHAEEISGRLEKSA